MPGMSDWLTRMQAMGGGYDPRMGRQWNMGPPPETGGMAAGMTPLLQMLGGKSAKEAGLLPLLQMAMGGGGSDPIGAGLGMFMNKAQSGEGLAGDFGTWLNQLFTGKQGALNSGLRQTPDGSPLGYYVRR